MWTRELLGTDVYHIVQWFLMYSLLGWFVESVYMSFCNRKVTNRGFMFSPFCPIYGFGAVIGYFLLRPLATDYIKLYFAGAILATMFEFFVAKLMQRLFGEVWWDYNDKPLNYKGILCAESSVAWGFYAIFLFAFVHKFVDGVVNRFDYERGLMVCRGMLIVLLIDFVYHFLRAIDFDFVETRDMLLRRRRT